jgi:riboflavin synthase
MFTGLVEGRGRVAAMIPQPPGVQLVIAVPAELTGGVGRDPLRIGESIAVSGCCLTLVSVQGRAWAFEAGAETLSRTNLGRLHPGDFVNLERALPVSGRLGGHFVQGHIDGVGTITALDRDGEWVRMWFECPPGLTRQMVSKGSVAVDGVSLTLVDVEPERFSVALIPHTLATTTLGLRAVGDLVNIETDIIGKYVEKLLTSWRPEPEPPTPPGDR